MKIDEEKERFESLNVQQEDQIKEFTTSRNELKVSNKFMKNAVAKKLKDDGNFIFLSEVFRAWTHTVKNEKKGLEILIQAASRKLLKDVFETVYVRTHNLKRTDLQRKLLYKLTHKMDIEQKQLAMKSWKRFKFLKRKESTLANLTKTEKSLDVVKAYFNRIKEDGVKRVSFCSKLRRFNVY